MSLVAPSIDSHRIPEGYAPLFRKLINVVKDIEEGGLIVEEQKRRGREQRLPRDEVTMVVLHQCTFPNRAQIDLTTTLQHLSTAHSFLIIRIGHGILLVGMTCLDCDASSNLTRRGPPVRRV
ncbi:hypothetical protein PHLCEN_2v6848 [Hermanssonia centrifuga]|uniref:Uncharacterized protein n=1 Tax=Hermanssonia centrifuga TaxID=98765 RepID=A0A2R6NYB8_9APHY|nr:hypothetical protein PHLCEN_2v6848 [Hermanssonia centrifuga]